MTFSLIPHPNGAHCFGEIYEMKARGFLIPPGQIVLFKGRHTGPNRGFGAEHIWAEHFREMSQAGFETKDDVGAFVATIVRTGTAVFLGDHYWKVLRIMTVRSS